MLDTPRSGALRRRNTRVSRCSARPPTGGCATRGCRKRRRGISSTVQTVIWTGCRTAGSSCAVRLSGSGSRGTLNSLDGGERHSRVRRIDSAVGSATMVEQTRYPWLACAESVQGTVMHSLRPSRSSSQPLSLVSRSLQGQRHLISRADIPSRNPAGSAARNDLGTRSPTSRHTRMPPASGSIVGTSSEDQGKTSAVQVRLGCDLGSTLEGAVFAKALVAAVTESLFRYSLMFWRR